MPFWKRDSIKGKGPDGRQDSSDSGSTGVNGDSAKPKERLSVSDYKARLQHKQYIVSISE